MNEEVVCVQRFSQKATSWSFRGTTRSTTRNILSRPGNGSHAVCHAVCRCPLQRGHWLQKNACVFLERCSDIFAKLYKPFELTLLPEEVVLLLVLLLSFPSLSLLQVMGQQALAVGDRVRSNFFWWQCRLVQFLREQQWWLAVTCNAGWHGMGETAAGLITESRDNLISRFLWYDNHSLSYQWSNRPSMPSLQTWQEQMPNTE